MCAGDKMMRKTLIGFLAAAFLGNPLSYAWGDPGNQLKAEAMIGKYDGVIQVIKAGAVKHPYQIEIVSVDQSDSTVSLSAHCPDCQNMELKRSKCRITQTGGKIKFICVGPTSDEEYTFSGMRLEATGFGHQYPYAISVTKVDD
jgi:hypothetical protein